MKEKQEGNEDQEESESEYVDERGEDKFNYVMKASEGRGECLPDYIKLENPFPGEPPFMRKRKRPAVLRFHKIKQSVNPLDYFFAEALLYTPFKSEEELERRVKKAEEDNFTALENEIKLVKDQVMEHMESNEEVKEIRKTD